MVFLVVEGELQVVCSIRVLLEGGLADRQETGSDDLRCNRLDPLRAQGDDVQVVVARFDPQLRSGLLVHGRPPGIIDAEDPLVPVRLVVGSQHRARVGGFQQCTNGQQHTGRQRGGDLDVDHGGFRRGCSHATLCVQHGRAASSGSYLRGWPPRLLGGRRGFHRREERVHVGDPGELR